MLVISRGPHEGFKFQVPPSDEPQEIHVVIMDIKGNRCKVGIEAPTTIRILRDELEGRPKKDSDEEIVIPKFTGPNLA